jgi:N-glycosylase/DNA lyase
LEYQEALTELLKFPGVGDKVANCVLLFSMDKLQAFPVDVWIKRVLRENYLNESDESIPDNKLRDWAQNRFGEFAGYANQYLFHQRRLI